MDAGERQFTLSALVTQVNEQTLNTFKKRGAPTKQSTLMLLENKNGTVSGWKQWFQMKLSLQS